MIMANCPVYIHSQLVPLHHRKLVLFASTSSLTYGLQGWMLQGIGLINFVVGLLAGPGIREARGQFKKPDDEEKPDKIAAVVEAWSVGSSLATRCLG